MKFITDFKTNHPILFWVALPFLIIGAIFLFFTGSKIPEEIVRPVEKQDADLKVEAQKIKDQAQEQVNNAHEIQTKIDSVNEETIPLDWHKKGEK